MKHTLTVKGMHCNSCVLLITEGLEDAGGKDIHVVLDAKTQTGTVTVTSDLAKDKLKRIIEEQGDYKVA
jgi:copper chaperone CopZ